MSLIFTLLALLNVTLYGVTMFLGFGHVTGSPDGLHILLGILASTLTMITHCLVFIYLIGTGLGVREAVENHGLDPALYRQTARFKARAFPFALFSMISVVVVAAMGARTDVGDGPASTHLAWALFALAFNLISFPIEIRAMGANGNLMDEVSNLSARSLGVDPS